MILHVLSGGAAQGIVTALEGALHAQTGAKVQATFGAVGAMRERLLSGEACDVVILTAALIADLEREGRVMKGASAPLGRVRTGIAVRAGDALPDISTAASLRATLLAARGIHFPDPQLATAGIHLVNVITRLGIRDEVAPRLKPFPNGATAMRALAAATDAGAIGCTQITEIKFAPGVALAGPLPSEFELSTVYAAAVSARSTEPDLARRFVELLAGPAAQILRVDCGFE
jgi:molybdate transport system substrate-binding protein